MSQIGYHRLGTLPDVALGSHDTILVTRLGTWQPVFDLTPDEAEAFADLLKWNAARAREDAGKPRVTREERDQVVHLVSDAPPRIDPFTYARPPVPRPGVWRERAAVGIFLTGLAVMAYGLISYLGGTG